MDALGGAPGVYSARYAGLPSDDARNNAKLLEALRDVPAARRGARFRCVAAFVDPGAGVELARSGDCAGEILEQPRGDLGFGYDPLFLVPALGPHDGGAAARREEPAVSPRRRVPGAGRRAARRS